MAIADGMGGHAGGATASKMAIDILSNEYYNSDNKNNDTSAALEEVFLKANRAILERSQNDVDLAGMGTTLTAIVIKENKFFFAHVGDSRGYLIDADDIIQFTKDHTLTESLFTAGVIKNKKAFMDGPAGNLLIKAIGLKTDVIVDVSQNHLTIKKHQRILLCCDGLYKVVPEPEIQKMVNQYRNPQKACIKLIERANFYGGPDNITVLVASMGDRTVFSDFISRHFPFYAKYFVKPGNYA
jgi:protein phosphatase